MDWKPQQALARIFDHTLLTPTASAAKIKKLCQEAAENDCFAVCIQPSRLELAVNELSSTDVKVVTVIAFPLGANLTASKVDEARRCGEHGAAEIDMVMDLGQFLEGNHDYVRDDIAAVCQAAGKGLPTKVIIETGYLSTDQIQQATRICAEAGAGFVKTSTGFGPRGASVEDICLMRSTLNEQDSWKDIGIKASGGIKRLSFVSELVEAGATRIGASASVDIISEWKR